MTTATKTPTEIKARSDKYIDAWNYQIEQLINIKWNLNNEDGANIDIMIDDLKSLVRIASSNLETKFMDIK